jgi:hypothetical protein
MPANCESLFTLPLMVLDGEGEERRSFSIPSLTSRNTGSPVFGGDDEK